MAATDLFLLITLISMLGIAVFVLSAIINLFQSRSSKNDWKRAIIFFGLTIFFFILFGISL